MRTVVKSILINHVDFAAVAGVSTSTLLRWVRKGMGGCPKPVRIVERTYLFNRAEALKWCRVQGQDSGAGPTPD